MSSVPPVPPPPSHGGPADPAPEYVAPASAPLPAPVPPVPPAPPAPAPQAVPTVPAAADPEAARPREDAWLAEEAAAEGRPRGVVGVDNFAGTFTPTDSPMPMFRPDVQIAAQALLDLIADDECSEVLMNGPNEVSRKVRGARYHCPNVQFGDADTYHQVLNEVVLRYVDTRDRIDGKTVVIEGQLELVSPTGRPPMLARVHIIAPPGVQYAKVTIAKKPRFDLTLDDLSANGTLSQDEADFLKACARGRMTVVVSGPTGSGKTTLLQALTHHFDQNDRIVVIEETPELRLPLGDVVYLRASLERPGMDLTQLFTLEFWTRQANRMRMDRVIVGEVRGGEMAEWLLAANSGAEGSATTVHANSPRRALDKILALATKNMNATSEGQLRREIAASIDVIVQVGLVDGRHVVTEIEEIAETVAQTTGQIQTNTIFAFDRARGMHVAKNRPSDEFIAQLAGHGVPVSGAWFRQQ